jgi:hypothetical protein
MHFSSIEESSAAATAAMILLLTLYSPDSSNSIIDRHMGNIFSHSLELSIAILSYYFVLDEYKYTIKFILGIQGSNDE